MEPVRVDVWSDIACPWCWLGHAHLQEASRRAAIPIDVAFHSFQLSPHQKGAEPVGEYLARKYGDGRQIAASQERLRAMGSDLGLDYDFEHALAANTFDAHRLHHFAAQRGLGQETLELLFRAQHAQGADVSDHEVLQAAGEAASLPAEQVAEVLASEAYAETVRADLEAATRLGIRGVPFFVLDRRLGLSGAQPVEVFEAALRQATEDPPSA